MKHYLFMLVVGIVLFASTATASWTTINYQGTLTDNIGNPITGTVQVTFGLYDAASDGTLLWSEGQDVDVVNGTYNVNLGISTPLNSELFRSGTGRFLALVVDGEELAPRHELSSVPNSFRSDFAYSTDWRGIANIPADIADGDNVGVDTNAATICSTGQYLDGDGACRQIVTSVDGLSGGQIGNGINVNGDVATSGQYKYTSPQTHWITIPSSSFVTWVNYGEWVYQSGYGFAGPASQVDIIDLFAPVSIPDGGLINSLTCYYYDNTITAHLGIGAYLTRRGTNDPYPTTISSISSSTTDFFQSTNIQSFSSSSINSVVSNSDYMYEIHLTFNHSVGSTDLRFYGCRMSYQVDQAD